MVQWPNVALGVWIVASVGGAVLDLGGGWGAVLRWVARVALGWWAVDEVVQGVNPWRRVLGAVVLGGVVGALLG